MPDICSTKMANRNKIIITYGEWFGFHVALSSILIIVTFDDGINYKSQKGIFTVHSYQLALCYFSFLFWSVIIEEMLELHYYKL